MEKRLVRPSNSGTGKMFDNPILERLTRTHVAVPISLFGIISGFLLYWGFTKIHITIPALIGLFFAGWLLFTWIEYMVHRYLFHMPTDSKKRERLQYSLHGIHHDYPKDKDRLAMPPLVSLTLSTILFFLFRFIMGDLVYGFLPGVLVGYAMYLLVHYIVHAMQPPNNFLKALWVNHGIHHYKDHDHNFGVSSPLWDYILNTKTKK